jgi:Holliday junction resolvasome RuvABC endonuclease subunit
MSLDPGLSNTGVATFDIDFTTGKILRIEAFTLTNNKLADDTGLDDEIHQERAIKLMKLKQALQFVLENTTPVDVACEAPFYNPLMPMAYGVLVEVVSHLFHAVVEFNPNIQFTQYPPMTVKKSVGAKAAKKDTEKGKNMVKEALLQIPEIMSVLVTDIELLSEHAIDAIAVGYTHMKHRSAEHA